MRIGILGGTYNPPHLGHLRGARRAFDLLKLDHLYLVPSGTPPHKPLPEGSPTAQQRLDMTELGAAYLELGDQVSVLDWEIARGGASYTVDTLEQMHKLHPDAELWLVMGEDMFSTFESWRKPERIAQLCSILTFARTQGDGQDGLLVQTKKLYQAYPKAYIYTTTIADVIEISSTEIRAMLQTDNGAEYLPPAVYGYILRHGLYGATVDMNHLTVGQLRCVALTYLKPKRFAHVLGCEQTAIRLALRYGVDVETAQRAALLHDCTKWWSKEENLAYCDAHGIKLDKVERANGKLLHAKSGAKVAQEDFGVSEEIAIAIDRHTTGHPKMTDLDKVIYLADYIEPTRNFEGLEKLRKSCDQSLNAGMVHGLSMTVADMEADGLTVHSATKDTLKTLRKEV
ncbi:nicotinate (nicotinamide) nucleotide adenylyltransferase [Bengtsoniella intestinalis]|uniref:nicotinate (nicotinamide) nucleotide adenylyltransferase n=1 Tax=Bengtsoniella intestinalis TaxID=3073143 RepID=UPI00391F94DA